MLRRCLTATGTALALIGSVCAAVPPPRAGEVRFELTDREPAVAEMFRLDPHTFTFDQEFRKTSSTAMEISFVTFPSPLETPHPENNTVHCEYFRPLAEGKRPAVIVLHILGGDFELSRVFCRQLAQNGVAALFLKLPYYGPRRPPNSPARMISDDPERTVTSMRQAVLDIRRGAAWLCAQEEIDSSQLGIFGISLGGITGALASTAEPRLQKICLMLAGGDMGEIAWKSSEVKHIREQWIARGATKEHFLEVLRKVDPVTYGENVRGRKILMINATNDEVIPKECAEALWRAFGKPEIVWLETGHVTAVRFILDGLGRVARFFQPEAAPAEPKK